jgi:hypothetical protein
MQQLQPQARHPRYIEYMNKSGCEPQVCDNEDLRGDEGMIIAYAMRRGWLPHARQMVKADTHV